MDAALPAEGLDDGVHEAVPSASEGRERLVQALLSCARHEFGSSLQSIQGFAELLGSGAYGALSEEQHTFVGHILQGSQELRAVLDACVELAELETVAPSLAPLRLPVCAALSDALRRAAESCQVSLQVRCPEATQSVSAALDPAALYRALRALLSALERGSGKAFQAEVEADAGRVRMRISGLPASGAALLSLVTVDELVRCANARGLLWLRLSARLLERQDALLRITPHLDCAEVCVRLSSTH